MIASIFTIMTPLLLSGLGALFCEQAGFTNIAIEGLILSGAFFSIIFSSMCNSYVLGVLLAMAANIVISLLMHMAVERLKANLYVAGLSINLLSSGLTATLSYALFSTKGVLFFANLKPIPALFGQQALFYIALALLAITPIILGRTVWGLRLRICGKKREALDSIGLSSKSLIMETYIICASLCTLAGASLSLATGSFVPNMSASRGWIALVLVLLGGSKPLGLLVSCLLYSFFEALGNRLQGALNVPSDFVLALPYVITLITLIAYSAVKARRNRF
jgi:ABC-type uncharacterized transport system permease subunit